MQLISNIKSTYAELPSALKKFIGRALILFAGWMLLYHLVLIPVGFPDVCLTHFTEWGTAKILSLFYGNVYFNDYAVYINNRPTVAILAACNGLELIVLYWGFLLCLPASAGRMLFFALGGFALICLLNFARCAALAVMTLHHHPLTDFAHHYAFKLIMYGVIFYLWTLYSKKQRHAK